MKIVTSDLLCIVRCKKVFMKRNLSFEEDGNFQDYYNVGGGSMEH
jgi:hypothetical protein